MINSVIGAVEAVVKRGPERPAIRFRNAQDKWMSYTWGAFDEIRKQLAGGLIELGVAPGDKVSILSNTSERWMLADLAIQSAGGIIVPIYQSSITPEVKHILENGECSFIFAEDASQLAKLQSIKGEIPAIKKVILMKPSEADATGKTDDWVIHWDDLIALGEAHPHADEIRSRVDKLTRQDILTIIYTSGTTGLPKGAVLLHEAMLYEVEALRETNIITPQTVQFMFLPMAHVFAKVLQVAWLYLGSEIIVDHDASRIVENLAEARPTMAASVPRVFEKVYAKVVATGLDSAGVKGKLFAWAMSLNEQQARHVAAQEPIPFALEAQLKVARKLVFSKINARLSGLFGGRLEFFISGGAPLPKEVACFFSNAGVLILEGWGLTETSAATCVNLPRNHKIGTVGPPALGTELKIAEDGEILVRGKGVMIGYYNAPEATAEALSADGWFSTGDIGNIDSDGHLRITDRKKDIIVTAGGKNVAPQALENTLKSSNPLISQVLVYGDQRKYLTALITIDPAQLEEWAKKNSLEGDYSDWVKLPRLREEVQVSVEALNSDLPRYSTIKEFLILPADFEVGDELTPTLKVKRRYCNQKFAAELASLYDEALRV